MHRSRCLPLSEVAFFAICNCHDLDESVHVIIQECVQLQENCSNTLNTLGYASLVCLLFAL